jgi:hypothetical protein
MLFETKEQFIRTVKTFKADEGLKQNVSRMEQYLMKCKQQKNETQRNCLLRVYYSAFVYM